jgi:hypothetical protein
MRRTAPTQAPNVKSRSRWPIVLPWMLVLLLAFSNIGALISARVHSVGFRAVETVLSAVAPNRAERILSRSTTRVAERRAMLVRSIASRTTTRLKAHAARSVATIPERVLPLVGPAAVVGFTLYDVQMDCDTAGDMNEILAGLGQDRIDSGPICRLADSVPSTSKAWSLTKESATGAQRKAIDLMDRVFGTPK